jgi:hypothetical protein
MAAYVRLRLDEFLRERVDALVGRLEEAYAHDGFFSQYTRQTTAWTQSIELLQAELTRVLEERPDAATWSVLLEYPLHRLRRRIDIVVLAGAVIAVVEVKVGADTFSSTDRAQAEEYALDLRDFHAESRHRRIVPILWCTDASPPPLALGTNASDPVAPLELAGRAGLAAKFVGLRSDGSFINADAWDNGAYRPVPTVIEAATHIFAGHDVRAIANADAQNLAVAARRIIELIVEARVDHRRYVVFLSGVPGSGKTLVGLQVVHDAVASGEEHEGDIVYLSGNTPLVTVLREALARDEHRRTGETLKTIRRAVRTRVQHIIDFLRDNLSRTEMAPPEHVIVFDEAQRAWDEKQGQKKFNRSASEPALLLEIMSRHSDWCVCVCLIGTGQEINSGEKGVFGWGDALRAMPETQRKRWTIVGPAGLFSNSDSRDLNLLGPVPADTRTTADSRLELQVPMRSFRSPRLSAWVEGVVKGLADEASKLADVLATYPIAITRSLSSARRWLRDRSRGFRRYGLVASFGARRLRADGLGETLNATDGSDISHWYLNPRGDIRASYALEVPANEYTCQGLELDYVAVCWGGDFLWDPNGRGWSPFLLNGAKWQHVRDKAAAEYIRNSYRVLLTRAREGMIIWIPEGDPTDDTRRPELLDATSEFLARAGAVLVE